MAKAPTEIRSLAREHTEAALRTLVAVMNQKASPPAARVAASTALLDRGWGKPAQAHTGEGGEGPVKLVVEWQKGE